MTKPNYIRNANPTEHEEQVALMEMLEYRKGRYPELGLLFAIPNGGARHVAVAKKLKAEGVKPGVPDLCLPVARSGYHGLYVEMKRVKGGVVSLEQAAWHEALLAQGYHVEVCKGALHAVAVILNYLRMDMVDMPQISTETGVE